MPIEVRELNIKAAVDEAPAGGIFVLSYNSGSRGTGDDDGDLDLYVVNSPGEARAALPKISEHANFGVHKDDSDEFVWLTSEPQVEPGPVDAVADGIRNVANATATNAAHGTMKQFGIALHTSGDALVETVDDLIA